MYTLSYRYCWSTRSACARRYVCRSLKGLIVYRHVRIVYNNLLYIYIYFFIFRWPRRAGANEKNRIGLLFPAAASTDRGLIAVRPSPVPPPTPPFDHFGIHDRRPGDHTHTHTHTRARGCEILCVVLSEESKLLTPHVTTEKNLVPQRSPKAVSVAKRTKRQRFTQISCIRIVGMYTRNRRTILHVPKSEFVASLRVIAGCFGREKINKKTHTHGT